MRHTKKQKGATALDWQAIALQKLEGIQNKCTCGACPRPKPKLPDGMRRLKIQPRYVDRPGNNPYVPMILLKGEWLRKKGFNCHGFVIIEEEPGRLVIRLENG